MSGNSKVYTGEEIREAISDKIYENVKGKYSSLVVEEIKDKLSKVKMTDTLDDINNMVNNVINKEK